MKRLLFAVGLATTMLAAGACADPESAPVSVIEETIAPSLPPTTTTPTTTIESTTPATKPEVTAVPMGVPIDKQETTTTTTPPTTEPEAVSASDADLQSPPEAIDPAVPWTVPDNTGQTSPRAVGWIQIPRIGLNRTTYRTGDDQSQAALDRALDNGPTYWSSITKPGEVGNAVIAGHRVSHGGYFRHLDKLQPGDQIILAGPDGIPHTYIVEQQLIISPNDTWIVNPREGATITLFACHPPGSIRQRIVIYANLANQPTVSG